MEIKEGKGGKIPQPLSYVFPSAHSRELRTDRRQLSRTI